tara:strand:+ start:293 stop:595 length:303 start_codon:yes stop_codon:yes gene_type:complete
MRTKQGINDLIKGIMLEGSVNVTNLESIANRIIEALTEENNLIIPNVSSSADVIDYIENDAEIAMPINELMHEDGRHLTKKEYGKVLLKYLVKELREHYC